ncbi:MAG: DUF4214 domain-containing protein [Isosphaeraceae bacterium]|nr:DUF4214 domain-containing protein [Isosphaeraceae bacterium]
MPGAHEAGARIAAQRGQITTAHEQFVMFLYRRLLHREPDPEGLNLWVRQLDASRRPAGVALKFLTSSEYTATHPDAASYVAGLYQDVLGRVPDPAGQAHWTAALMRGTVRHAGLAWRFLHALGSFLRAPGATAFGGISSVSVNKAGWATGMTGSNVATVAGSFNPNDFSPAIITITVNAPGTYVLQQSNGSYIGNSTGRTWSGFTFAILSTSTAKPTFVSSTDRSGHFPTPSIPPGSTSFSYTGGMVNSCFDVISCGFQPYTTITAANGGTIVVQETSIPSSI